MAATLVETMALAEAALLAADDDVDPAGLKTDADDADEPEGMPDDARPEPVEPDDAEADARPEPAETTEPAEPAEPDDAAAEMPVEVEMSVTPVGREGPPE